jgi:capsular polysaccharide biosynthesis protein
MTDTLTPARPLAAIARVADLPDHQARMDQPLVAWRLVDGAGRSPAPAPAFMFGPSDAELTRQIYGQTETPEIGCTSVADAALAPTGIGLRQDVAFSAANLNLPREHVATIVARLNQMAPPCREVAGPLAALFGPAEEDAGHLLVDYLPRLWLLEQAGYALETLRFVVPDPLPPFLGALVGQLGIAPERLVRYAHWDEALRTDLLLLPTILRRHGRLSPRFGEATRFWTARLRAAAGLPDPVRADKIYVPDPDTGAAPLRNRYRIEAIAERLGYRVVMVAQMGLAERAAAFGRAARIVGPYGTALHHSVFAASGTAVCALRGTGRAPGTLQTGLCAALGQRCGYVFGQPDPGGFSVEESDFRRALEVMDLMEQSA